MNLGVLNEFLDSIVTLTGHNADLSSRSADLADDFAHVGQSSDALSNAFKKSTKHAMNLAAGLAAGESGIKIVNRAISSIGEVADSIPLVGGLLNGVGKATTFLLTQFDEVSGSYSNLNKSGLVVGGTFESLANRASATGVPIKMMASAIKTSSKDITMFGGNAAMGAELLTDTLEGFQKDASTASGRLGMDLRTLGFNVDDMAKGAADYMVLQRRLGYTESMSKLQLQKGTAAYLKELNILSRLTGKSNDALQAERDAAMSESRFRASMMERSTATAKQFMNLSATLSNVSPEIAQGFRDMSSGMIHTDAAQKLIRSGLGDTVQNIIHGLDSGTMGVDQAFNALRDRSRELSAVGGTQQGYAKIMGDTTNTFIKFADLANLGASSAKSLAEAAKNQTDAMDDGVMKSIAKINKSTEALAASAQELVTTSDATKTVLAAVASGSETMSEAIRAMLDSIDSDSSTFSTAVDEFGGYVRNLVGTQGRPEESMQSYQDRLNKVVSMKGRDAAFKRDALVRLREQLNEDMSLFWRSKEELDTKSTFDRTIRMLDAQAKKEQKVQNIAPIGTVSIATPTQKTIGPTPVQRNVAAPKLNPAEVKRRAEQAEKAAQEAKAKSANKPAIKPAQAIPKENATEKQLNLLSDAVAHLSVIAKNTGYV